MTILRKQKLDD